MDCCNYKSFHGVKIKEKAALIECIVNDTSLRCLRSKHKYVDKIRIQEQVLTIFKFNIYGICYHRLISLRINENEFNQLLNCYCTFQDKTIHKLLRQNNNAHRRRVQINKNAKQCSIYNALQPTPWFEAFEDCWTNDENEKSEFKIQLNNDKKLHSILKKGKEIKLYNILTLYNHYVLYGVFENKLAPWVNGYSVQQIDD